MTTLAEQPCLPCKGGVPPLPASQAQTLLAQLDAWEIIDQHHLSKTYTLPDFATALQYVNHIGAIAEEQNHHPDLYLSWGSVRIDLWTHAIHGLTESDFIFAAKVDRALAHPNTSDTGQR